MNASHARPLRFAGSTPLMAAIAIGLLVGGATPGNEDAVNSKDVYDEIAEATKRGDTEYLHEVRRNFEKIASENMKGLVPGLARNPQILGFICREFSTHAFLDYPIANELAEAIFSNPDHREITGRLLGSAYGNRKNTYRPTQEQIARFLRFVEAGDFLLASNRAFFLATCTEVSAQDQAKAILLALTKTGDLDTKYSRMDRHALVPRNIAYIANLLYSLWSMRREDEMGAYIGKSAEAFPLSSDGSDEDVLAFVRSGLYEISKGDSEGFLRWLKRMTDSATENGVIAQICSQLSIRLQTDATRLSRE